MIQFEWLSSVSQKRGGGGLPLYFVTFICLRYSSYDKEKLVVTRSITLAGLRRLLEEDLELEKRTLDPFKEFISQQVDEVCYQ